jgi:hypothetical protein
MKQATFAVGQIPEGTLGRVEKTGSKLGTVVNQVAANLRLFLAVHPVPSEACLAPKHEGKVSFVNLTKSMLRAKTASCAVYKDEQILPQIVLNATCNGEFF